MAADAASIAANVAAEGRDAASAMAISDAGKGGLSIDGKIVSPSLAAKDGRVASAIAATAAEDLRLSIAAKDGRSDSIMAVTVADGLRPSIAAATPVSELRLDLGGVTGVPKLSTPTDSATSELVSSWASSALARPFGFGGTRDTTMLVSLG